MLRSKIIRLAHAKPELRPHLLPLLVQTKTAATWAREYYRQKMQESPEATHFVDYKGTDVEGFIFPPAPGARSPTFHGVGFYGKQTSPAFNYSFKTFEAAEKELNTLADQRLRFFEQKRKQMQERKDYAHDYVAGDILYSSWGYDQTNVDFYEVTGVLGKQITLRAVGSKVVRSSPGIEYVVAQPGRFTGPPMKKLVQQGGVVKIDSVARAYKWDGTPRYETASGWGH
jgi:hypothetical protein